MQGSAYFQWLRGPWTRVGYLKTTNLPLSDADANLGTIPRGKLVNMAAANETEMAYTTANMLGILENPVSLNGVQDATVFRELTLNLNRDQPVRRGLPVGIRVPGPGSEAIFEGKGAFLYDNLVCTTSTGAISGATARFTELTCEKGCWRLAVIGENVYATLEDASLTPYTATQIRMRVKFCSPYIKSALS